MAEPKKLSREKKASLVETHPPKGVMIDGGKNTSSNVKDAAKIKFEKAVKTYGVSMGICAGMSLITVLMLVAAQEGIKIFDALMWIAAPSLMGTWISMTMLLILIGDYAGNVLREKYKENKTLSFAFFVTLLLLALLVSSLSQWGLMFLLGFVTNNEFAPIFPDSLNKEGSFLVFMMKIIATSLSIGTDYSKSSLGGFTISVIGSVLFWITQIAFVGIFADKIRIDKKEETGH